MTIHSYLDLFRIGLFFNRWVTTGFGWPVIIFVKIEGEASLSRLIEARLEAHKPARQHRPRTFPSPACSLLTFVRSLRRGMALGLWEKGPTQQKLRAISSNIILLWSPLSIGIQLHEAVGTRLIFWFYPVWISFSVTLCVRIWDEMRTSVVGQVTGLERRRHRVTFLTYAEFWWPSPKRSILCVHIAVHIHGWILGAWVAVHGLLR